MRHDLVQTVCKNCQQRSLACTPVDNALEGIRQYIDRHVVRGRLGNLGFNIIWASTGGTLTLLHANNKGADQPAHIACAYAQSDQHLCYSLSKK